MFKGRCFAGIVPLTILLAHHAVFPQKRNTTGASLSFRIVEPLFTHPGKIGVQWRDGETSTYVIRWDNHSEVYKYSIVGRKTSNQTVYYWIEMSGKFENGEEITVLILVPMGSLFFGDAKKILAVTQFGILPLEAGPDYRVAPRYSVKRIGHAVIETEAGQFPSDHLRVTYTDGRVDDLWINAGVGPQGITKAIIRERGKPEKVVLLKKHNSSGAKPTFPHLLSQ